jgi:hypothetical protein
MTGLYLVTGLSFFLLVGFYAAWKSGRVHEVTLGKSRNDKAVRRAARLRRKLRSDPGYARGVRKRYTR